MHQNLAIILWQFNYSKNTFIVFVPEEPTNEAEPAPEVPAPATEELESTEMSVAELESKPSEVTVDQAVEEEETKQDQPDSNPEAEPEVASSIDEQKSEVAAEIMSSIEENLLAPEFITTLVSHRVVVGNEEPVRDEKPNKPESEIKENVGQEHVPKAEEVLGQVLGEKQKEEPILFRRRDFGTS